MKMCSHPIDGSLCYCEWSIHALKNISGDFQCELGGTSPSPRDPGLIGLG